MFEVKGRKVGKGQKPFMIAEMSANHGGSILRAKDTILSAKKSGANAVKIQSYTPDTMTIDSDKEDFLIKDGLWSGYNLYQLYQEAYTPFEWHKELFEFAQANEILLFSTPFDETAVDLLVELEAPAFKIASFEITDLPLIEYVASKKRPMFMSTGMSNLNEIADAVEACYRKGNKDLLLFHCISNYPAYLSESNLGDIQYIADHFDVEVGLSDHTTSNTASVLAVALGASAIEKHFKFDEKDCGPDSSFSIMPEQFSSLCIECEAAFHAVKSDGLQRRDSELNNKKFRRSIYFVNNLTKGQVATESDMRRIRPGYGLEPKYFRNVIGKVLKSDVKRGDPVSLDVFED